MKWHVHTTNQECTWQAEEFRYGTSKGIEPLLLSAQVRHALQVSLSRLFGVVERLVAVVAVVLLCRHGARLFSILLNFPPPQLQIFSSISLAPNIHY